MHGYKHLKCLPEELPDLLATLPKGYIVSSCVYENGYLHIVVVK